jgi:hypothetical protein
VTDPQRIELSVSFANTLQFCEVEAPPPIQAVLTISYGRFTITAKGDVMYTLPVDMIVQMQVSYVDASNNPATVDGPVVWASSDDTLATATPDANDSTIVTVTPVGPAGQVQITATADADLGAGVRNLVTVADISLVAGEAVAGTIEPVGAPTPKP